MFILSYNICLLPLLRLIALTSCMLIALTWESIPINLSHLFQSKLVDN